MQTLKEEYKKCQCKDCINISVPVSVLTDQELDLLCISTTKVTFQRGEKIIKQDSFCQNIVFIKSGIYKIHQTGPINRDEILKVDKGPQFVGIPDAFAGKVHTYSVSALTETIACMIDFQGFRDLIEKNGKFSTEILKTMSRTLIEHYGNCVNKIQKQLTAFLADSLLYFTDHIYERDEFEMPLTRKEWGEFIGTTRESVTKIVHALIESEIIEVNGRNIRVINKDLLQKISNTG
ncbi:MAG: Crp/Fnr family transcriptional regulator [Bacteroidales bacterium]